MTVFNLMKRNQSLSRTCQESRVQYKRQGTSCRLHCCGTDLEARPPWRGPGRMCQCRALAAASAPALAPAQSLSVPTACAEFTTLFCAVPVFLCVSVSVQDKTTLRI